MIEFNNDNQSQRITFIIDEHSVVLLRFILFACHVDGVILVPVRTRIMTQNMDTFDRTESQYTPQGTHNVRVLHDVLYVISFANESDYHIMNLCFYIFISIKIYCTFYHILRVMHAHRNVYQHISSVHPWIFVDI